MVQGDIYALPFEMEFFDFVYSLGVLQHTPNVAKAFKSLPPMLRYGGMICVDYYEKSFKRALLPKYWIRYFTKHMDNKRLFRLLRSGVPGLLTISRLFGRVPAFGNYLRRLVPVANYEGILPLNETQLQEWALLDTFDWLSPAHDYPQSAETARTWLEEAAFEDIEILRVGHLVGRGKKVK